VTIEVLSAATDEEYSSKDTYLKINFVTTDNNTRNLGVARKGK